MQYLLNIKYYLNVLFHLLLIKSQFSLRVKSVCCATFLLIFSNVLILFSEISSDTPAANLLNQQMKVPHNKQFLYTRKENLPVHLLSKPARN